MTCPLLTLGAMTTREGIATLANKDDDGGVDCIKKGCAWWIANGTLMDWEETRKEGGICSIIMIACKRDK